MKSDFQERRHARIDGLYGAAARAEKKSDALLSEGHKMFDAIPFGQPILVGHHSEGRDRNYRDRASSKLDKGFEEMNHAKDLEHRAAASESNDAIFSDDPEAIAKIEERVKKLEEQREKFKDVNKLVRKGDREGLRAIGLKDSTIEDLFKPDFAGRVGIPGYNLTNRGAEIRRLKERLEQLKKQAGRKSKETILEGGRVVESVEDNRVQIYFDRVPPEYLRDLLKSYGFRWAPSVGAWQRHLSNGAEYWAYEIVKHYMILEAFDIYDGRYDNLEAV